MYDNTEGTKGKENRNDRTNNENRITRMKLEQIKYNHENQRLNEVQV